jgi:hypothetical protein
VPLRARGAGRQRPARRPDDPPDVQQRITTLYEKTRLNSREISVVLGLPERTVRDRLRRYGVQARTRGAWSREQRRTIPAEILVQLYVELGLPAETVGQQLGTSGKVVLRSAHAHGLPVQTRGSFAGDGGEQIELIDALYADSLVAAALRQYGIRPVPAGGPIYARFPIPLALTTPSAAETAAHKNSSQVSQPSPRGRHRRDAGDSL